MSVFKPSDMPDLSDQEVHLVRKKSFGKITEGRRALGIKEVDTGAPSQRLFEEAEHLKGLNKDYKECEQTESEIFDVTDRLNYENNRREAAESTKYCFRYLNFHKAHSAN